MRLDSSLLVILAACHSVSGPSTLVRVDHEPSGPDCPTGGVAINTGLDRDGNRVLDDDEISSTQFVCNGTTTVQCGSGVGILRGTITVRDPGDWAQLTGINCIDGELLIAGTTADSIPDYPDLKTITGDVAVVGNPELTSLGGLEHLIELGGGYLIQGNPALTDISALGKVARAGSIQLIGNDALHDLAGLEPLVDIDTVLVISNNAGLTSLDGLDNLRTTTRTLAIRANRALTSAAALGNLRQVQLLEISGNDALPSLTLASLQKVDVRLLVTTNSALTQVSLPVLSTVGDFAQLSSDPVLVKIDMPQLLTIGSLFVSGDNSLTALAAPHLAFATAGVQLTGLPRLATARFDSLTSIGGTLGLGSVPVLPNLSGFSQLESIGGDFSLVNAGSLHDFTGLDALDDVLGAMTVTSNAQLTSFAGLARMTEVGGDLTIGSNPLLPKATSQAFAQRITVRGAVAIN